MGLEDLRGIAKRLVGSIGGDQSERNIELAKQVISGAIEAALKNFRYTRTCLLAEPNRGECERSVGVHAAREKSALEKALGCTTHIEDLVTDEGGRPPGWCEVCWRGYRLKYEQESQANAVRVLINIVKAKENALKNLITVLEDGASIKGEAYQEALNVAKRAVSRKDDQE